MLRDNASLFQALRCKHPNELIGGRHNHPNPTDDYPRERAAVSVIEWTKEQILLWGGSDDWYKYKDLKHRLLAVADVESIEASLRAPPMGLTTDEMRPFMQWCSVDLDIHTGYRSGMTVYLEHVGHKTTHPRRSCMHCYTNRRCQAVGCQRRPNDDIYVTLRDRQYNWRCKGLEGLHLCNAHGLQVVYREVVLARGLRNGRSLETAFAPLDLKDGRRLRVIVVPGVSWKVVDESSGHIVRNQMIRRVRQPKRPQCTRREVPWHECRF